MEVEPQKTCTKCGEEKSLELFYRSSKGKFGRASWCKNCKRLHKLQWRKANPEKAKAESRRNRNQNRKQRKEYMRRWHQEHRTESIEYMKCWYQENREYVLKRATKYRKTNKAKILGGKYGLSVEDYQHLLKLQDYKCAICSKEDEKTLGIDHNHATKIVRGFLCGGCNSGLGQLQDSIPLLESALEYLRERDNDAWLARALKKSTKADS